MFAEHRELGDSNFKVSTICMTDLARFRKNDEDPDNPSAVFIVPCVLAVNLPLTEIGLLAKSKLGAELHLKQNDTSASLAEDVREIMPSTLQPLLNRAIGHENPTQDHFSREGYTTTPQPIRYNPSTLTSKPPPYTTTPQMMPLQPVRHDHGSDAQSKTWKHSSSDGEVPTNPWRKTPKPEIGHGTPRGIRGKNSSLLHSSSLKSAMPNSHPQSQQRTEHQNAHYHQQQTPQRHNPTPPPQAHYGNRNQDHHHRPNPNSFKPQPPTQNRHPSYQHHHHTPNQHKPWESPSPVEARKPNTPNTFHPQYQHHHHTTEQQKHPRKNSQPTELHQSQNRYPQNYQPNKSDGQKHWENPKQIKHQKQPQNYHHQHQSKNVEHSPNHWETTTTRRNEIQSHGRSPVHIWSTGSRPIATVTHKKPKPDRQPVNLERHHYYGREIDPYVTEPTNPYSPRSREAFYPGSYLERYGSHPDPYETQVQGTKRSRPTPRSPVRSASWDMNVGYPTPKPSMKSEDWQPSGFRSTGSLPILLEYS